MTRFWIGCAWGSTAWACIDLLMGANWGAIVSLLGAGAFILIADVTSA